MGILYLLQGLYLVYKSVCPVARARSRHKTPDSYTRDELLGYLEICRQRCQATITSLSSEEAHRLCRFPWGEVTFAELQLYSLRHVQEHSAQLHMLLGQQAGLSADWVGQAKP